MIDFKCTADEVIASGTDTAILPIGSTEQHGPHLPLCTDFFIAGEVAKGVAEKTGYYLLPALPISTCYEHKGKKGSVWMRPSTFYTMLQDIVLCLRDQGFRRVAVILAHGGIFMAGPAIRELNATYDNLKVAKVDFAGFFASPEMNDLCEFGGNLHAGEVETSLMLFIAEKLVKKDLAKVADFTPDVPRDFLNYCPLPKLSKTGIWGKSSLGTKEKGEKIFNLFVEKSIEHIDKAFDLCSYEAW